MKLIVTIKMDGRLPSWNQILAMEHWGRVKVKEQIQLCFLSALRQSARNFSMKTTCVKNTMSIAADTLVSYRETNLIKRKLRSANAKRKKEN